MNIDRFLAGQSRAIQDQSARAARSTGPRTPEGKAVSSRNALKHGLTARQIVIKGESQAEFDALLERLTLDANPRANSKPKSSPKSPPAPGASRGPEPERPTCSNPIPRSSKPPRPPASSASFAT